MESIVEDVEEERETECNPANSQKSPNFDGWDDMKHSRGVYHSYGVFIIRYGHDIFSEAIKKTINISVIYKSILSTRFEV